MKNEPVASPTLTQIHTFPNWFCFQVLFNFFIPFPGEKNNHKPLLAESNSSDKQHSKTLAVLQDCRVGTREPSSRSFRCHQTSRITA